MAEVVGVVLDGVGELHDGGHLLHGEVGDGAEVAAAEALGGFAEGGVGLDAESGCRLGWCGVIAGDLWRLGFIITVLLPMGLFSCRRCAGVCCTDDLVECFDGGLDVFALENERREESEEPFRWCG